MAETFTAPAGYPKARLPSLAKRVRQAVEGVKAGGGIVSAVEISPDGGVRVLTRDPLAVADAPRANPWDEVLSR